jgi:hypothetical protein
MILESRTPNHRKHFPAGDLSNSFAHGIVVKAFELLEVSVLVGIGFWVLYGFVSFAVMGCQ